MKRSVSGRGETHQSQMPSGLTSTLAKVGVVSFFRCVSVCIGDYMCRAAWFDEATLTCTLLGPGDYSGLQHSQNSTTFVREGFTPPTTWSLLESFHTTNNMIVIGKFSHHQQHDLYWKVFTRPTTWSLLESFHTTNNMIFIRKFSHHQQHDLY